MPITRANDKNFLCKIWYINRLNSLGATAASVKHKYYTGFTIKHYLKSALGWRSREHKNTQTDRHTVQNILSPCFGAEKEVELKSIEL